MYTLPEKIRTLVPYTPMEGDFAMRLDANESFLALPRSLCQEIAQAVAALDFNRYPDPYCRRLCQAFGSCYGVEADRVVAGNGSDELIGLIVSCFGSPDLPLVVVQPDFSMYSFYAQLAGVPVRVYDKSGDDLALDVDKLLDFCQADPPSLLILSNPCNPTSLVAGREELLRLAAALPQCLVVADEAYMDFSQGSVLDAVDDYDNLLVLKTCSKAMGLAAIRLGFAVGSPTLVRALQAVKSPYNVNAMTQAAGEVVLSHPDYLADCVAQLKKSRDELYRGLRPLAGPGKLLDWVQNTQANFVYAAASNAEEIFLCAAREGIALRRMGGCLRITAGSPQQNRSVLALLQSLSKKGNA